MSPSASSNSAQTIINVVFGLSATIISVVTVLQGHRVWKMWREHARGQGSGAPDIELGLQSSPPTPTSAEAPDRDEEEEEVATASPLAEHTGDVASSNHTPVSVQATELQSTPTATTIHAETSLSPNPSPSPSLVQGAQTENDGHLEVYAQDAQPANTHMGPGELGPAANDGLGSGRGSQV